MSSQNEATVRKMKTFFGNEALIIMSRIDDYVNNRIIKAEDIDQFYELLLKEDCPISDEIVRQNFHSCILYYHSFYNYKSREDFHFIENKLNDKCDINENNFFLICNIIEFEDKYPSYSDTQQYQKLLRNLSRFKNFILSTRYSFLFFYYKTLLYFLLKNYQECEKESMNLFAKLFDLQEQNKNSKVIEYLVMSNRLLVLRLKKECMTEDNNNNQNEFENLLYDLYRDIKPKNMTLGIKLANYLADIYISKLDLKKSEDILKESIIRLDQIKFEKSENLLNQLYIILQLKLIRTYAFKYDIKNYQNEIEQLNEFIQNEHRPNVQILNAFIINTYLLDIEKNFYQKEKNEEIINTFIQCFFPPQQSNQYIKKFLINEEIIYNNLFALNYDISFSNDFEKRIASYINKIKIKDAQILCGNLYTQSNIVNIFIYIFNKISSYTYRYITDSNKKLSYKKEILNIIKQIVNYIHTHHKNMPCLKNNLVKNMLNNLYALFLSLCDEKFQKFVDYYNSTFSSFLGMKPTEAEKVGLIIKAIADEEFNKSNYNQALNKYMICLECLKNDEEYRKGIILFNIGICHLMMKKNTESVEYLRESLKLFTKLRDDFVGGIDKLSKISTLEFYEQKIQTINNILGMFG